MNSLKRRIATLPQRQPDARPVTRGTVPGPAVNATSQMVITPGVGSGVSPLTALVTSDGAMIPATGPGQWDQLVTAGRIR